MLLIREQVLEIGVYTVVILSTTWAEEISGSLSSPDPNKQMYCNARMFS